jgi:hypothetical protein
MDEGEDREAAFWLIDLIMLMVVTFLVFQFIGNVGEVTTFQKRFLANDMALMIDTLSSVPGEVTLQYPQNTLWFGIQVKNNRVEVFEDQKDPPYLREQAFFIPNARYDLNTATFIPDKDRPKESFMRTYMPVFALLETEEAGLNLTFQKTYQEIGLTTNEKSTRTIPCSTKTKSEVVFIQDDQNKELYKKAQLATIAEIKEKTEKTKKTAIYITLKETGDEKIISSYTSEAALSCTLVNSLLEKVQATGASARANKNYLKERIGTENQDLLTLEISGFGEEEIITSLYSALSEVQDG